MKLEYREIDDVCIVDILAREVDHSVCTPFHREIDDKISKGATKLAFNMDQVEFLDSMGIGTMITIKNKVNKENGRLCLFNITSTVKKVLDITSLHKVLDVVDTEAEMLDLMNN